MSAIDEARQARIDALVEQHIASAADPLQALTLRVEVLEAELARRAEEHVRLMDKHDPASHNHEWGEVREKADRCVCVTWNDWKTGLPGRKYNRFCRVHAA